MRLEGYREACEMVAVESREFPTKYAATKK